MLQHGLREPEILKQQRLQPALQTLNALLDNGEAESFDFAFIDADGITLAMKR